MWVENHSLSESDINTQAAQTEAMSKVFGMFGEGKDGTHVSKDKLGDVLRSAGVSFDKI